MNLNETLFAIIPLWSFYCGQYVTCDSCVPTDLSEGEDTVTSPEQVTTSFMQLVSTELDRRPSDTETTHADDDKGHLCFTNISQMLGAMSADNVSGCVRLLEDLHIKDTVMESE